MEAPRRIEQRKYDTLARLSAEKDAWIATADAAGNAYLLPLSFLWDGVGVIVSTQRSSVTGRNMSRGGRVRAGIGALRDVTIIDGSPEPARDEGTKDAFAAKHGWDPRREADDYAYFRLIPDRVQAWREANELPGRLLMRDGNWLV
jgi:hypothetical protein